MSTRIEPRIASFALCLCILSASGVVRAEAPESEDQKTIYALGLAVAQNLKAFNLSADERKILIEGLEAGLTNQNTSIDPKAFRDKLNDLAKARVAARASQEREASTKFLADAASQKGAQRKASGLIYRETKAGSGDSPTTKDSVKVAYTGKRRDGSVFDSSIERGQPVDFPLGRMIPCWTEGLALMKPGGKARLTCPPAIAYGERGAGGVIPPNATLQFEVELLSVRR